MLQLAMHMCYFHRIQNPIINMHNDTLSRPYIHCNEIVLLVLEKRNRKKTLSLNN
jgi:hypothetical protein